MNRLNYVNYLADEMCIRDRYKPKTEYKNKFTMLGDIICNQREYLPIYSKEAIAGADLFLYQVFNAFELPKNERYWRDDYWFPTFYVYASKANLEWEKMKSKRYCKKMFSLFGVDDIETLKKKIEKCVLDLSLIHISHLLTHFSITYDVM